VYLELGAKAEKSSISIAGRKTRLYQRKSSKRSRSNGKSKKS
jgi:hypothetical protein